MNDFDSYKLIGTVFIILQLAGYRDDEIAWTCKSSPHITIRERLPLLSQSLV